MLRQLRRTLDESHLIVFDDLERSPIEPKALAGLIDSYLEHKRLLEVLTDEQRAGDRRAGDEFPPFLHHVDVGLFVDKCLELEPERQFEMLSMLRRELTARDDEREDSPWAGDVARCLSDRAASSSGFVRHRLLELAAALAPGEA